MISQLADLQPTQVALLARLIEDCDKGIMASELPAELLIGISGLVSDGLVEFQSTFDGSQRVHLTDLGRLIRLQEAPV